MPYLPGFQQGRTVTAKEIWYSTQNQAFEVGGVILDGTTSTAAADNLNTYPWEIRVGHFYGRYTTNPKKGRFCTNTVAVGAGTTSTALTVRNAIAFLAGDSITVGGTAATIASINYTTNVITLTASATWTNGAVVLGTDGSQVPYGILSEFVSLKNIDNTVAIDASVQCAKGGMINADQLYGDVTAILAWINANPASNFLKNIMFFSGGIQIG